MIFDDNRGTSNTVMRHIPTLMARNTLEKSGKAHRKTLFIMDEKKRGDQTFSNTWFLYLRRIFKAGFIRIVTTNAPVANTPRVIRISLSVGV